MPYGSSLIDSMYGGYSERMCFLTLGAYIHLVEDNVKDGSADGCPRDLAFYIHSPP